MTIDECINDYEQVIFGAKMMKQTEVYKYHTQLVEWLRELKERREIMKFIDLNVRVIETNDGVIIRFGDGNLCEWVKRMGVREND